MELHEATQARPWQRVGLGLFIGFQLVYLPAANWIKLVPLGLPASMGELDDDIQLRGGSNPAYDAAGWAMLRWGELTGQAQGWSLFAPRFGHQASLPAVLLIWNGPPRRGVS